MAHREILRYLVQKQMICKVSGAILDEKKTIMMEEYRDGKHIKTIAIQSQYRDRLPQIREAMQKHGSGLKAYDWNGEVNIQDTQ